MAHRLIDRIREKIRLREYDMTVHAMEEMAEDDLDVLDIEEAVLNGRVVRTNKVASRGTKYTVEGNALDYQTLVGVVGRFAKNSRFLIITYMTSPNTTDSASYGYRCEHCEGTVQPKKIDREAFKHKKGFIILEGITSEFATFVERDITAPRYFTPFTTSLLVLNPSIV